jgi:hypothetical protein
VIDAVGAGIVECDLAGDFDLGDPDTSTARIETATGAFVGDMERFLTQHQLPN